MTAWLILGWTVVYLALRVPLPVALVLAVNSSMYHFVEMPKKPKYIDLNKQDLERM